MPKKGRPGGRYAFVPVLFAMALLAGCNSTALFGLRGPAPSLQQDDVKTETGNQEAIISALIDDSRILIAKTGRDPGYYDVALTGFNVVDSQCTRYFDTLFYANREKDTAKSLLQAGGQTTAAILGITKATELSIQVVGQAFGFAISATDAVSSTFLYQLPPATTYGFVRDMQKAYRDGLASRRGEIDSAPAAYDAVHGYLELCLPPKIEANLLLRVSTTKPVPDTTGNSSAPRIDVTGNPPPASPPAKPVLTAAEIQKTCNTIHNLDQKLTANQSEIATLQNQKLTASDQDKAKLDLAIGSVTKGNDALHTKRSALVSSLSGATCP